ncbi:MAG: hypothetical protein P4L99_12270 [Chthoniobacter sp.]|nr:hypothetical protein [Chthoniobacter sp.]
MAKVVVYDAVGRHEVPVEHAMDLVPPTKARRKAAKKKNKKAK